MKGEGGERCRKGNGGGRRRRERERKAIENDVCVVVCVMWYKLFDGSTDCT